MSYQNQTKIPQDGSYKFPNDVQEQECINLQHGLFSLLLDGNLFLAPIGPTPHTVLDIGTGTGLWAMDFADGYPCACIIGTDLSPIQPAYVPPNCKFEIDDANDTWNFADQFDFIHCRQLHVSVEETRLFWQSFNALKSGAWFEIKETFLPMICNDNTLEGTALGRWQDKIIEASEATGTAFDRPYKYRQWMEEAGFANVEENIYHIPLNPWPEDPKQRMLGEIEMENVLLGIEGFSMALFTEVLGWSREELEVLLVDVRKEIKNGAIHAHMRLVAVIGQKPE